MTFRQGTETEYYLPPNYLPLWDPNLPQKIADLPIKWGQENITCLDKNHFLKGQFIIDYQLIPVNNPVQFKGKGTQKYQWILSNRIQKTTYFESNCMKIGFFFFKKLRSFVFKMAATGGCHFEINIKTENY